MGTPIAQVVKEFSRDLSAVDQHYPLVINHEIENQINKAVAIVNEEFAKHKNTKEWKVGFDDEKGDAMVAEINGKDYLIGGSLLLLAESLTYVTNDLPRVIRLVVMILHRIKIAMERQVSK